MSETPTNPHPPKKEEPTPEPVQRLELRAGDVELLPEQLLEVSVFAGLAPGVLKKNQAGVLLRKFREDEVICNQGDAGWTAFYILTTADLQRILEAPKKYARLAQLLRASADVDQPNTSDDPNAELDKLDPKLRSLTPLDKRTRADEYEKLEEVLRARTAAAGFPPLDKVCQRAERLKTAADNSDARNKAIVFMNFQRNAKGAERAGFFKRIFGHAIASSSTSRLFIPNDGPVDLRYDNPVDMLHEGELFGEMSCMTQRPRSASIRTTADCYMIEMLRNVLDLLQRNKPFQAQMEKTYRTRVLKNHFRELPLFAASPEEVFEKLRQTAELIELEPGDVLIKEGDPADNMYIIRLGTIKVSQHRPGGERVIAYRGRGEIVGEIGILDHAPRGATCTAYIHPNASKKNRIEVLRISQELLAEVIAIDPKLKGRLRASAETKHREDKVRTTSLALNLSGPVEELGLSQGEKLMLIDLERCTRCDECVRACVSTHGDGRTRLIRDGAVFDRFLVPMSCRQCMDPVCMIDCPVASIHKGDKGQIVIEDWCIGCGLCARQCPYDAIYIYDDSQNAAVPPKGSTGTGVKAVVCDQCSSLAGGTPSCVYACPHDAARREDALSFFSKYLAKEKSAV